MEDTLTTPAPTFTVVMSTYKRPQLLPRAIRSVLDQTYPDFELVVIDDASGDNTAEVVAQFGDSRVRYICQPTNQGAAAARNRGQHAARGRYITYLDDDDRFEPTFLAEVYSALNEAPPSVGLVITGRRLYRLTDDGQTLVGSDAFRRSAKEVLSGRDYVLHPIGGSSGLVVTAACHRAVGDFDQSTVPLSDTDFMIRAAAQFDFLILPELLLAVTNLPGQQATTPSRRRAEQTVRLADRHAAQLGSEMTRRYYRRAAAMYYSLNDCTGGRQAMRKAFAMQPFDYRVWALWPLFEVRDLLPARVRKRIFGTYRHG